MSLALPTKPNVLGVHTTTALVFSERTADRAARLRTPLPALAALTACAHVQWDMASSDVATFVSLAVPALANALQLRAFAEPGDTVRVALVVRGHHAPFHAAFRADGRWHHVCATWEQQGGRWALFADGCLRAGARGLGGGHPVPPGGILVLGQDQDSPGGGFSARDAFSGNITDFHFWAQALSPAQLQRARACAPPLSGLLFRWDPSALDVTPSLLPAVQVHLLCPDLTLPCHPGVVRHDAPSVPSEECPMWNPGRHTEGFELCLQPRPFLCCYRTETYWQLQDSRSWPGQDVISHVNALANATVLLRCPLSEAPEALSLDKAASFLGTLERVLAEETAPLGPAALLAVVHFLKRVTALGAGELEHLTGPWEQLGQGVVSVTSLVLDEQLAGTWLSISEMAGGPMALVVSMQRLTPLLSTVLTSTRPRMLIQHHHAGLDVQSLYLGEASTAGHTFTMPGGHAEGPGHIHIPAGEVRRLLGKVIHSWFASSIFQQTLGLRNLVPQTPNSLEEASRMQRLLSTQVGSAILSSEVWDAAGEVSTAVTFHLQHQAQVFPQKLLEPVCAFWDFSISPDTGGSWATSGCSVLALHQDSTTCFCNHSTNFAVLLQVYDVQRGPEEESLLRTLSFVGCGVSFCALTTTFLLFLVAGVPKSERTTVHKNLTFSLASAEGFLMASEWAKTNKAVCMAVTAAMHLLFLVAFSWMLVEGLLLWDRVVTVSMRPGPRMRLYHAAGWGVPVVIMAVTLATHHHDYMATGHCWLNVHTDVVWAFVGPVLFVLTANSCILVRVVMVTVSSARRHVRMLSPQLGLQQQIQVQMWATVKPVLVLLPVLGLSWLVGLLVHLSPAWAYAAVGLNSFQGPYIFLVYTAYNGEVQNALQRMMEKKVAEGLPVGQTCSAPPACGPQVPGQWSQTALQPQLHLKDMWLPERRPLQAGRERAGAIRGAAAPHPRRPSPLRPAPTRGRSRLREQEPQRRLGAQVTAPLSLLNGCVARAARSNRARFHLGPTLRTPNPGLALPTVPALVPHLPRPLRRPEREMRESRGCPLCVPPRSPGGSAGMHVI
uniref:Adhesion G-protein coupled receptor D2 n=1 Tax=Castor canadensis TaxID=51338 RepID=A0A8B7UTC9_CASCN|nr:adhesion G-protein coupled receptor D2 [Castor canadensis]